MVEWPPSKRMANNWDASWMSNKAVLTSVAFVWNIDAGQCTIAEGKVTIRAPSFISISALFGKVDFMTNREVLNSRLVGILFPLGERIINWWGTELFPPWIIKDCSADMQ